MRWQYRAGHLGDWEALSQVIEARLKNIPQDPEPLRQKARLMALPSKFDEAGAILKKLIDSGWGRRTIGTNMHQIRC